MFYLVLIICSNGFTPAACTNFAMPGPAYASEAECKETGKANLLRLADSKLTELEGQDKDLRKNQSSRVTEFICLERKA